MNDLRSVEMTKPKFKVGGRVWDIANKSFVIFKKLSEEHSMDTLAVIERDNEKQHYPIRLLHQTSDDMFKELGYEIENGKNYIEYRNEKTMEEITIYTDEKTINCCYYDYEDELPLRFTMQEHQAIHQKLIELEWIK